MPTTTSLTLGTSPSIALALLVVLTACGGGESKGGDTAAPGADSAATAATAAPSSVPAPTEGFSTPESVRYDSELDVYYVSNINGVPSAKDGNGFIAKVDAKNPASSTMLVEGGKNGATLNAPKGMALKGDTLWVADIDALRAFDRKSGATLATIDFSPLKATFLNDIAVGPDGALYVTDTGIEISEKGMSHPGVDRLFVVRGGKPAVALSGDKLLTSPNGIAWDAANGRFILGSFGSNAISAWKVGDTTLTEIAKGPGQFDGVEVLADGRILVSSWADSSVSVISGSTLTKVAGGLEAPADIGVDTQRNLIAVPRFNAKRVEYISIPK